MASSGDEDYSDHDLDALASEDFLELQEQALQATQHRDAPHQLQPLLLRGQPISQSEVDRLTRDAASAVPRLPPAGLQSQDHAGRPADQPSLGPHSNVGEPMADETTQREQWRRQRFSRQSTPGFPSPAMGSQRGKTFPHRPASQDVARGLPPSFRPIANSELSQLVEREGLPSVSDGLEVNMHQLLLDRERWIAEKATLEKALKATNEQLQARNGEVSILRSSHAQQVAERDRHFGDLQHQQRVLDERHRSEVEKMQREKEKLVIQNRFLDHENHERSFTSKPSRKGKGLLGGEGTSTPRRPRSGFGDGFEDDELQLVSPSKTNSKHKTNTPKAGAKRKRDALNASPFEVPVVQSDSFAALQSTPRTEVRPSPVGSSLSPPTQSDFLHKLLYHKSGIDDRRVFDLLAEFKLPSQPDSSLAKLFMDKAPPSAAAKGEDIPASFGLILADLWSRCLSERYYRPVKPLIDAIQFVLDNGSFATALRLIDDVVSLAQRTADVNVIHRFKKLNKNAKVISVHLNDQTTDGNADVDTQQCLELLYGIALTCARDHNAMTRFWHCMRFDFISMLLRVVQHIDDITLMVHLLHTCAEQDCFGSIKPPSPEGGSAEQHVIDRLSSMLIEIPRPLDDRAPYEVTEVLRLRLTLLGLIEAICEQKLCGLAIALHPLALGRMVRVMSDELNAIYANPAYHDARSEIVDHSVRILYYLMTTYSAEIDLKDKLRRQPGGVNKFLITLSRLAFSDAVWYERWISEDAFDCAHQLLEDFVTPEEATALKKAFVKDDS